jgi:uncharacterized protein YggT (Ycf19 family)
MDDLGVRLLLVFRGLIPFLFMMASVYLATHMLVARLVASPKSQVLAFFTIVTSPLTRPVRAILPSGTGESRVRAVALAVYVVLWIATDWLARLVVPAVRG